MNPVLTVRATPTQIPMYVPEGPRQRILRHRLLVLSLIRMLSPRCFHTMHHNLRGLGVVLMCLLINPVSDIIQTMLSMIALRRPLQYM